MTDYAEKLGQAFGYLYPKEIAVAKKFAGMAGDGKNTPVFVNIGAGAGTSSLALREGNPDAVIFTVDIAPDGPLGSLAGERNAFAGTGLKLPFQVLGDSKEVGLYWERPAPFVKKNTIEIPFSIYEDEEWAAKFWGLPLDLLLIDGDHSEDGLTGDMAAWLGHVRKGGYVLYHDYESKNWPAVVSVTDGYLKKHSDEWKKVVVADTLLVTVRK